MRRLLTLVAIVASSFLLAEVTPYDLHDEILVPLLSEFNDLKNHLSTLDEDLVSKFGTNHNDLQAVRTAINDAKGSVDNVVSRLGTLNSNMSTLIDRVNSGNLTLGTINQGVSGILSTIDDVLTATRAVRDNLTTVNTNLVAFATSFDEYTDFVTGEIYSWIVDLAGNLALLVNGQEDTNNWLLDIDMYVDLIYNTLAPRLEDIVYYLKNLTSISTSTAGTYTNVLEMLNIIKGGVSFQLGPTSQVQITTLSTQRVGMRWLYPTQSSLVVTEAPTAQSVEISSMTVPPGGYFNSLLQRILGVEANTKQQVKSGVLSALSGIWTTNYLGKVQQPLLVDLLAAADAETNYLYSVQADMLRAITNSLANLNATNNQQSAQTEDAYSEMAASVSNQVASLDMDQNADRFDSDTAGFSPSLSSDALSAFDAVKSGLGGFATRAERKAQEGANGIRLGITLPQYAVGETTLLNGDEFLGTVGDPNGANGVHRFFTSVRSVFLAVWTVAYLGVAFGLWCFLVGLWHRVTSLFGETVDKSMMV